MASARRHRKKRPARASEHTWTFPAPPGELSTSPHQVRVHAAVPLAGVGPETGLMVINLGYANASVTAEDARRGEFYRQERERAGLAEQATTFEDYLASLDTRLRLGRLDAYTAPRIAQLVRKTNQLNMTTIRRSQHELEALASAAGHEVVWASVTDRFGDAGVVGVAVVARADGAWRLDTFLLSCRVLKRGVEAALLRGLSQLALADGAERLEATWVRTRKNASNRHLYRDLGFAVVADDEDAGEYVLDLRRRLPEAPHISLELPGSDLEDAA